MRLLKYGLFGEDVKQWQNILVNKGYDLSPYGVSGHFDRATHNATISFQRERNLDIDGVVGDQTWGAINITPDKFVSPLHEELITTFIQAKNYTKANRTDIKWIVLHSMEAPEASSTAENVASWFAGPSAPQASAHFNIDSDSIVQSVKENDIAWHAKGGNRYGIGLEHAGYARQTRDQWLDTFSVLMLQRSAKLTASLCKKWDIPIKFVDRERLKSYEKGITTHNEITMAFHAGDHVDPGKNFPMDMYLRWVSDAIIIN